MIAHFWLRRGRMMLRPHLYCLPSRFTHVRSFYWVLGLCGVRQGYGCVGNGRCDDYSADSFASLAQCCSCGGFFPSFAIFALVWGLLPCAVLFLRACSLRSFPSCRFPWGFQVTGCLSFCFPGDVGWASALPSFFVLLLLRLLAGVGGVMHPVSGCSSCGGVCLAEGEVTLLPFPYLRVGVLLACGVSGVCGLRGQSRLPFVVRHDLGFADRLLWPLDGPGTCCFLEPYLGFFPLTSSVGCWVEVYPWLSSLRSFAVEGVDLVLYQVLVGLPSWCCCASGLLG